MIGIILGCGGSIIVPSTHALVGERFCVMLGSLSAMACALCTVMNCEFAGHSAYKDYISTVTDPVNDPITTGLSDYVVTDELYHPHVFDRERSTIFLTAFDCE